MACQVGSFRVSTDCPWYTDISVVTRIHVGEKPDKVLAVAESERLLLISADIW